MYGILSFLILFNSKKYTEMFQCLMSSGKIGTFQWLRGDVAHWRWQLGTEVFPFSLSKPDYEGLETHFIKEISVHYIFLWKELWALDYIRLHLFYLFWDTEDKFLSILSW